MAKAFFIEDALVDETLDRVAHRLIGAGGDYDPLMESIGSARLVLLGEATHGTHEFYRERAEITKRLITEKQFTAVAVEADWPDAYRINRYVRGMSQDAESIDALADFKRFPTWMWRNADVLNFVGWLRAYNDALPGKAPKSDSMDWTFTVSIPQSKRCFDISERSIPKPPSAPSIAMPVSTTMGRMPRPTPMPPASD